MEDKFTALMSFPCSGAQFLRKLIEKVSGIATGSDLDLNINLPAQATGSVGELIAGNNRVWVTNTHHPLKFGNPVKWTANRRIVLVRNPIEVIPRLAYFW